MNKKSIQEIVSNLGLDGKKINIFEMTDGENKKEKRLILSKGRYLVNNPWLVIDAKSRAKIALPADYVMELIGAYEMLIKENFDLKLKMSIFQELPVDFNDVWEVCISEMKKNAQNFKNNEIDLTGLVKGVKSKYPNLFLNVDDFTVKVNKNG